MVGVYVSVSVCVFVPSVYEERTETHHSLTHTIDRMNNRHDQQAPYPHAREGVDKEHEEGATIFTTTLNLGACWPA